MIINFTVKNYKSIKEEMIFNMQPVADKSYQDNLIITKNKHYPKLLKSAFICGQNASGKSNTLEALDTMRKIILSKPQSTDKIEYFPFKLDTDSKTQPTEFKIIFLINDIKYIYGFSYNSDKIISEYLYYYPNGKVTTIFKKKENEPFKFVDKIKQQEEISSNLSPNSLYLPVAAWINIDPIKEIYEYFSKNLIYISSNDLDNAILSVLNRITIADSRNDIFKQKLEIAITHADLGAKGIAIGQNKYPNSIKGIVEDFLLSAVKNDVIKIKNDDSNNTTQNIEDEIKQRVNNLQNPVLSIKHTYLDDAKKSTEILFDLTSEESNGTKRLIFLMSFIIDALQDGKTILIDEIELNLHPNIIKYITSLFNNINNKASQLIFTTHNYDLLDLPKSRFRKDQIWFTEKDNNSQETKLYSLSDFKERKGLDIKKRYFIGKYGSVPNIYGDVFG
jgi:hypothetical protein